jgi:hypothetical protein
MTRKRAARRAENWRTRIANAATSEQFYDTASDWLRAVTTHVPDEAKRTDILNSAGQLLAERADTIARGLS